MESKKKTIEAPTLRYWVELGDDGWKGVIEIKLGRETETRFVWRGSEASYEETLDATFGQLKAIGTMIAKEYERAVKEICLGESGGK